MWRAADYADEWFKGSAGAFRMYYICRAGNPPCNTLIESKAWDTLKEDPLAVKQRWYCKVCFARYKTRYGCLIEIVRAGVAMYCQAELPPPDLYDAKGMIIQERFKGVKDPEALLNSIPEVRPVAASCFQQVGEGIYKIMDADAIAALERFQWDQLYNLAGVAKKGRAASAAPEPVSALEELRI